MYEKVYQFDKYAQKSCLADKQQTADQTQTQTQTRHVCSVWRTLLGTALLMDASERSQKVGSSDEKQGFSTFRGS